MNPVLLQAIFLIIIFFLSLTIAFMLKFGGHSFRQYIKSKLPGFKHKGAWFIQAGVNQKVRLVYKKLPDDLRIKIKSGEIPEDDQYATINEVFHQTDDDGVPVLFTLEDLPFTFFLKKHHLDDFFPQVDEMINLIDEITYNKMFDEAESLKLIIKNKLTEMKPSLKYIPNSIAELNAIFGIEKSLKFKDKPAISILLEFKKHLFKLKESILESNRQFVNVHDLFQTTGFVKNLTKIAFMEWQNGFLAAKQTKMEKKFNTWLVVIVIIVGVLTIIGIYLTNSLNERLDVTQQQLNQTQTTLLEIKQVLGVNVTDTTNTIDSNLPVPNNPLQ